MSNSSSATASAIVTVIGLCLLLLVLLKILNSISQYWKLAIKQRLSKAIKNRKNENDNFRQKFGYSWDFFIAFKVYGEEEPVSLLQRTCSMKYVLDRLTAGGLETRLFYSLQRREVFCKIRCPLEALCKHADLVDYKLAFDSDALRELCGKGREGLWEPLKIPEKSDMTRIDPYQYIYGKYEFDTDVSRTQSSVLPVYKRWGKTGKKMVLGEQTEQTDNPFAHVTLQEGGENAAVEDIEDASGYGKVSLLEEASIFRGVDRLKLIHMIICYHGPGGCALDPYKLIKDECILAYSPMHDFVELVELEQRWINFLSWPWNQPFDDIKNYFGEKIGLYFLWLGTYTTWLIPAAILGFCIWLDIATTNNSPNATSVPYFAGMMGLWSALFLESFKRLEKITAMKWGMTGFEEEEQLRPQFKGEPILSPITGKPTLYFSRFAALRRSLLTQGVISVLVLIVIAVVACIFFIQITIKNVGFIVAGADMSSVIASILFALQIQFLNGYFGEIALRLNNYENHRTDTEFEDSLIAKTFCFQFVNSFASLFYIAFIKPFIPNIDACGLAGCMGDLQTTLSTIFITRLVVGNSTELGIPLLASFFERRTRKVASAKTDGKMLSRVSSNSASRSQDGMELSNLNRSDLQEETTEENSKGEMSEVEKTFVMAEYHVMLGPFEDFAEMVIQFGYTTMFVAAFPLATVLSLVNNYVEIRVDAWKLCHISRRPEPRSMEDIGTWYIILELISMSSIFINSALVAFTSKNCSNYSWTERVWIFILMASGLFFIRALVAYLIPDEPEEVIIQLDRQSYIVGKVLDNVEDDDDAITGKNNFEPPNFLVAPTDDDPM